MGGISTSLTNDETIFPNAPPIMTPMAMSSTLPFMANSLNHRTVVLLRRGSKMLTVDTFNAAAIWAGPVAPDTTTWLLPMTAFRDSQYVVLATAYPSEVVISFVRPFPSKEG